MRNTCRTEMVCIETCNMGKFDIGSTKIYIIKLGGFKIGPKDLFRFLLIG